MNATLLWRLVWKDYRVLRGYWLALAILGAMVQVLAWQLTQQPEMAIAWQLSMAVVLPGCFALGGGATLFALEREERTDGFLRGLPLGRWTLFAAKLALAVVATAALAGLLLALAAAQPPSMHKWELERLGWAMAIVMVVQVLGWSLFFSLLLSRPLLATFLAAVAWLVALPLQAVLGNAILYLSGASGYAGDAMLVSFPIFALVLLAVDAWLAGRWLHGAPHVRQIAVRWPTMGAPPIVGRMLWQQARQGRFLLLGLALLAVAVGTLFAAGWGLSGNVVEQQRAQHAEQVWTLVMSAIGFVCSLLGSCVFLGDQENRQFRFLADLGVSPRTIWWSRQLFWMAAAVIVAGFTLFPALVIAMNQPVVWEQIHGRFTVAVLVAALAYSAGQLASMLLASGLLAAFFGLILSGVVVGWAYLMIFLAIDWRWSAAPIVLLLLAASRVRAPGWLLERRDWRAWLPPAAVVGMGLPLLVLVVAWYRIAEIPVAEPRVTSSEFAAPVTDDERVTALAYRQAWESLDPEGEPAWTEYLRRPEDDVMSAAPLTRSESAWVKSNENSLRLALDATQRDRCAFEEPLQSLQPAVQHQIERLATLIVLAGRQLEADSQLDEALEHYLAALRLARHVRQHSGTASQDLAYPMEMLVYARLPAWAAHSGQSADSLRAALGKLTMVIEAMPSIAEAPARDDRVWYESIRGALADGANARPLDVPISAPELLARWLPWERRRMGRVLDYAASVDYERIRALERQLSTGGGVARFPMDNPREVELCQSTLGTRYMYVHGENLARSLVDMATFRRATRLTLYLMAWRLEQGSLPESLMQFSGSESPASIQDPYSEQPFRYEPGGLQLAKLQIPGLRSPLTGRVADGRPMVWSVGPKLRWMRDGHGRMGYQVVEAGVTQLISAQDAWHFGWAFPIPDQAPASE